MARAAVRDFQTAIKLVATSNQYGQVADASWQDGMAQLTAAAWIYLTKASQTTGIVDHNRSSSWSLCLGGGAGTGKLRVEAPNGTADSNTLLPIGQWVHVGMTYDGAAIKPWVNGVAQTASVTKSGNIADASTGIYIGRFHDAAVDEFDGLIDEVAIWDTALSAAQMLSIAQQNPIPTANLLAYYKMDEGAGTAFNDSSGNGRNGTWTATPSYTSAVLSKSRKAVGGNLVTNGNFEFAPPFTAVTNNNQRWIDGTGAGSTTNDNFGWGIASANLSAPARFDSTEHNSGSQSLKISTVATGSFIEVHNNRVDSAAGRLGYAIPCLPNTSYTMTYYMKTNYVSGDSSDGAFMSLGTYDGALAAVSGGNGTKVKTTTGWTQYTITLTTGATVRYLVPKLLVYGHSGTATLIMDAWFDDITLTPTTNEARVGVRDFKAALAFDGVDDIVSSASTSAHAIANSVTFAVWAKFRAVPASTQAMVATANYIFGPGATAGTLRFTTAGVKDYDDSSGIKILPGAWYHFAVAFDSVQDATFYINGVLSSTVTGTTDAGTTASPFRIGANNGGAAFANAIISQAKMFGSVLTGAQIRSLYLTGVNPTAPLFDYRLDEGAGSSVTDYGSAALNGTITGAAFTADTPMKARQLVNANLVKNGDFEYAPPFVGATTGTNVWIDGTVAGAASNELFRWGKRTFSGTLGASFDSSTKHLGAYSLKITATAAHGEIGTHPYGATPTQAQLIPVLPSTSYTLTGYVKTDSFTNAGVQIYKREWSGALAEINEGGPGYLTGTNDWTLQTHTFTTAATTRYIYIAARIDNGVSGGTGTAWFDDIVLRPTTPIARSAA